MLAIGCYAQFGAAGLARKFIKTTHESGTKGTFQWMAPESIRGGTYSKASDSWSYGVIVWELLTSQSPYSGLPWETVAYMVGVGGSSLPIPSSCPRPFADLLEKCWAKVPTDRPGSAECVLQLQDALRRLGTETSDDVRLWNDMQLSWKDEMAERFKTLEKSENEMRVQQSELRETQRRATLHQTELDKWETSLRDRERDLQFRELTLLTVAPVSQASAALARRPSPVRRRTRFRIRSGASSNRLTKVDIGSPSGFKHVVHLPNGDGQKLQNNVDGINSPVLAGAMPVSTREQQLDRSHTSPSRQTSPFRMSVGGLPDNVCTKCYHESATTAKACELCHRQLLPHTPPLMKRRSKSNLTGGSSMAIGPFFRNLSGGATGMSPEPPGSGSPLSPGSGSPLSPLSPGSGSPLSPSGRSPRHSSNSSAEAGSSGRNNDRMQKSLSCALETPTDFWGGVATSPVPVRRYRSSTSGNLIPGSPASTPGTHMPTASFDGDLSRSLPPIAGGDMAAAAAAAAREGSPKAERRRMSIIRFFRRSSNTSTSSHEHVEAWAEVTGEGPAWHADPAINWFYPMMSREDTRTFLRGRRPGAFVVRASKSHANSLAICVMQENNQMWNGLIVPSSAGWRLGIAASAQVFPTPAMLIEFYTKLPYSGNRLLVPSARFDSPLSPRQLRDEALLDSRSRQAPLLRHSDPQVFDERRRSLSEGELMVSAALSVVIALDQCGPHVPPLPASPSMPDVPHPVLTVLIPSFLAD